MNDTTEAVLKAQREAARHAHPQRLMRVVLECAHIRLLPWNGTAIGIGARTACAICPEDSLRTVVNIEETGVLSAQGIRRAEAGQ